MERNQRETRKSFIIIIFTLVFLIGLISGLTLYINKRYQQVNLLNEKFHNSLLNTKTDYQSTVDEYTHIKNELTDIENINENTNKLKEDVFKLAAQLEKKIQEKDSKYKIAYLTFDDGPYYLTNKYLDVLKKYKVKGTFFTIGLDKEKCYDNRNKDCSGMYKRIVDEGHTIANHTYSHLIFKGLYSNSTAFINQVKKQQELVEKKTGVTTNIVRFPGGSGTAQAYGVKNDAIKKLKKLGYGWVDWSAMDGDGGNVGSKQQALNTFQKSINEDIEVVLLHDYSQVSLAILPEIITYLQDRNYILLPLFYDSVKVNK